MNGSANAINDWQSFLEQQKQQPYYQNLKQFVAEQRHAGKSIYPPKDEVFTAFQLTPLNQVKVVILGQDPYHGAGQAHGLSFSVKPEQKIPPSLRNMYKELATDIAGFQIPTHGYLESWATQGVFLLNAVLTVEEGQPNSHAKKGWETFTDEALKLLNAQTQPIVFLLWGAYAQKKAALITAPQHQVLKAVHPSPLSANRGFFGCQHFSQTNAILSQHGQTPIHWQI